MQAAIMILQTVCLVIVIVAIVYVRRARSIMKNAQDNLEKVIEYQRKVRKETEAKFQKMELDIAAIRDQKKGPKKRRQKS